MPHPDIWKDTYIGIGSNLGERRKNCEAAIALLQIHPLIHVIATSSWHETKALTLRGEQHPDYINGVVRIETILTAHDLLRVCKGIEKQMGRRTSILRWQSRTIDLDILLYGDLQVQTKELTIPHPEMNRRSFVLEPLKEILLPQTSKCARFLSSNPLE